MKKLGLCICIFVSFLTFHIRVKLKSEYESFVGKIILTILSSKPCSRHTKKFNKSTTAKTNTFKKS
jgi:hypothetical protein